MTPGPGKWVRMIAADLGHPHYCIEHSRIVEVAGCDLYGEARTVDAMAPRRAHTLDAGYGPGRHTGWLFERGHHVVGVDVDPVLITTAQEDHPGPTFLVGDLTELDLPARGIEASFDIILSAGSVMGFLVPSVYVETLRHPRDHLAPEGRVVAGLGASRGYELTDFPGDAQTAGLNPELAFPTWDLRPWHPGSDFLMAVLTAS